MFVRMVVIAAVVLGGVGCASDGDPARAAACRLGTLPADGTPFVDASEAELRQMAEVALSDPRLAPLRAGHPTFQRGGTWGGGQQLGYVVELTLEPPIDLSPGLPEVAVIGDHAPECTPGQWRATGVAVVAIEIANDRRTVVGVEPLQRKTYVPGPAELRSESGHED